MHVVQRGNNRMATFRTADDFLRYRQLLLQASERFECAIHAYVLMTNHVHLLLTPPSTEAASQMMQSLGTRYVRYVNRRHQRTGSLWEGRFRSSVVDSENYLLTCARYIELNPVRAAIVSSPDEYSWSSYRCNAYGAPDSLITPHSVYQSLGSSSAERRLAYRALFARPIESTLDGIRDALQTGAVLGARALHDDVARSAPRAASRMRHGGDRRSNRFAVFKEPGSLIESRNPVP
ncbi:MAG TPA: transposase [Gemmatimonadaceae bacterium]|nr:transposase [Gemmatimonadaceae bacterium]